MRVWPAIAAVFVMLALGISVARAQVSRVPSTHDDKGHAHAMLDLVQGARDQCDQAGVALEELVAFVAEAKRAKDVERMRSTLTAIDDPARQLRHHLASCMDIMKMIQTAPSTPDQHGTRPSTDHEYVMQMLQHHRDGIELARIAADGATNADVKALAQSLLASEARDLTELTRLAALTSPPARP